MAMNMQMSSQCQMLALIENGYWTLGVPSIWHLTRLGLKNLSKKMVEWCYWEIKPCRVQGVGSVRIKMPNKVERVLTNVRFIPELKRNLISLGMLDDLGYVIKVESRFFKILKGLLIVMKGIKKNGIYFLLGRTVIGSVSIAHESSLKRTCYAIRGWDM